jgi:heptose I phosphotransferase
MTCAAFGLRGANPAQRKSFIVTEALTGTQSLETVCRAWSTTPPAPRLKHALIRQLARMCRIMHNSGMNHRDCYLCHFLLDVDSVQGGASERPRVYVIDLHRAQIRTRLPQRWREKDLAGLAFSALDLGLTRTDCMRFIREYEQEPLATVFRDRGKRWRNVRSKALSLYQKEFGRPARTQIR